MLAEQQLIEWFRSNGVDIGLPIPLPLMGRLFRKALACDPALFTFLGKSCFTASDKKNYIVISFNNWNDVFRCYTLYGTIFLVSEA